MTYMHIHTYICMSLCVRKSPQKVEHKNKRYGKQKRKNKVTIRSILQFTQQLTDSALKK